MAEILHNTFMSNSAGDYGGTIFITAGVTVLLSNNMFQYINVRMTVFEHPKHRSLSKMKALPYLGRCAMLKHPAYSLAPLPYTGMHPVNFP